jgi:excinuclease ABC subunit C
LIRAGIMGAQSFKERLKALPHKPGVYLFRDASGNVLYVGKAADLNSRVRSYFSASANLTNKLRKLVPRVSDFEFFVTDSDQEALILECNLIKKHRPRYNVRLKDDKTYPYLKINVKNDWPRVYITRRVDQDGSRYFGPYASAVSVKRTLNLLKQLFPFRSCRKEITGIDYRPCLEYHIHRCAGPCVGEITAEDYRNIIDQVIMFLEGKQESVVRQLREDMMAASGRLDYERAAVLRDQLRAVEMVTEHQKISSVDRGDQDVIALAQQREHACVEVFFIRGGRLVERDHFVVQGVRDEVQEQVMAGFLNQFYSSATYVPPLILLQHLPPDSRVLEEWLSSKKGSAVRLRSPLRGANRKLVDMVAENARQGLEQMNVTRTAEIDVDAVLSELQNALDLPRAPRRIECFDISDIGGTSATGSMVVFEDGQPKKSHYRRFRIKTVEGADDYAKMQEVLKRRFKKAIWGEVTVEDRGKDENSCGIIPDLILIDGGRGHLNAALDIMEEMENNFIPIASIAKENEEIFRPGVDEPIILPRDSAALHLLQRVRDEAHRFAISYHRKVRSRRSMGSALDSVPGVGPKRKKALLRKFGSVKAIREAGIDDIAAVPGMTQAMAQKIKEFL